jgi:hypothetical protein
VKALIEIGHARFDRSEWECPIYAQQATAHQFSFHRRSRPPRVRVGASPAEMTQLECPNLPAAEIEESAR